MFPPPHTYIAPRDYTTNMGYVWFHGWAGRTGRGELGLGVRHPVDDGAGFYYPWINAPPATVQRLGVFLYGFGPAAGRGAGGCPSLHQSRPVSGAPRIQNANLPLALGLHDPSPQPRGELGSSLHAGSQRYGDRRGDHLRLPRRRSPARSDRPASGRAGCLLPDVPQAIGFEVSVDSLRRGRYDTGRPLVHSISQAGLLVHEQTTRGSLQRTNPKYGSVYHVGSADDILEMVRREKGILYQTHPRTKDSFGYPDKVRDTNFFKDPRFIGAGWKAMPADRSTLRQGVRALNLLNDMNNWGLPKRLLAETDMFAIDHTSELYAHMNANYVRIGELPDFDNYGRMLEAVSRGDYFISMGEVLLPEVRNLNGVAFSDQGHSQGSVDLSACFR